MFNLNNFRKYQAIFLSVSLFIFSQNPVSAKDLLAKGVKVKLTDEQVKERIKARQAAEKKIQDAEDTKIKNMTDYIQIVNYLLNKYGMDAWDVSLAMRDNPGRVGGDHLPLRNAEHYLWVHIRLLEDPTWKNQLILEICTVGYTPYKQLRNLFRRSGSEPSIDEMNAGLQGILDARKKIYQKSKK
ncbi:MAG: hypothetical protein HQM10_00100 [Candidatus Riflebacteria bacterium]|nr:hypothetical protein [Candidatus Riflebacteria bacterium]